MKYILFFLLFLLPFLIVPFGSSQFEVPKVIAAEVSIELLAFIFFIKHSPKEFFQKKYIPIGLLFGITLFDLFFFQTDISLFGNAFRHQGIFLIWHLLMLYLLATKISLPKFPIWIVLVLLGIQVVAAVIIGTTVTRRAVGTLGEPNALAAFTIFLWPFALMSKYKAKQKLFLISSAFGLTAILIFLSGSRSGILALAIQTIFLLLSYPTDKKRTSHVPMKPRQFSISVLISFLLFLLSLVTPFVTPQNAYENRVEVWKVVFWGGFESPLLGGGFGNIEKIFHPAAVRIDLPIQYYYVDSSHNIFLDFWLQGGIIGLSIFLIILFQTVQNFIKQKNTLGITLLLGLLTVMSFNPASVATLVVFWWLMGFSYQAQLRHKNRSA